MLSNICIFAQAKERGLGSNKIKWFLKTNQARNLYLNMNFKIYCSDHLIQNKNMTDCTRKYWKYLMTHVQVLDVVVEYYMYPEFAEGKSTE